MNEKKAKLELILKYAELLNMKKVCNDHLIKYQTYKNIKRGNYASIKMLDTILRAQAGESASLTYELSVLKKEYDKLMN